MPRRVGLSGAQAHTLPLIPAPAARPFDPCGYTWKPMTEMSSLQFSPQCCSMAWKMAIPCSPWARLQGHEHGLEAVLAVTAPGGDPDLVNETVGGQVKALAGLGQNCLNTKQTAVLAS